MEELVCEQRYVFNDVTLVKKENDPQWIIDLNETAKTITLLK